MRSLLSYEHLWTSVRVKGGAYGAGFIPRRDGGCYFYSYRDPSPERSLLAFRESCDFLEKIADSGTDLTKFIIGAYGEYDVLTTPRSAALAEMNNIITGWSEDDEAELRKGLVETSAKELKEAAKIIREILESGTVCVAGARDIILSFKKPFDEILDI